MRLTPRHMAELGARRNEKYFEIRGYMHRAGFPSVPALAREVGKSANAVHRTLHGTLHTPEVLDALREVCGVPVEMLFDPRNAEHS